MILEKEFSEENLVWLDFTKANTELAFVDLKDTEAFHSYVLSKVPPHKIGIGGWLEDRIIYKRSEHFTKTEEPRTIHLGLDLWVAAETPVLCPMDGVVYSVYNNKGFGDYGPTIILKHFHNELGTIYTLYGHLSKTSLDMLQVGQDVTKGSKIGTVGPFPENGDWPPHLHFQVMKSMEGNTVDYPGVCSSKMLAHYSQNCINPMEFLGIERLI